VTSETAALVSGSSVMLAAFGFYYNAVKDGIDAAAEASATPANPEAGAKSRKAIRAGRKTAWVLALVALLVFALLSSYLVHEIEAAVDVRFALSAYSTLDVIFVVLALGWLGIAVFFGWHAIDLSRKLTRLDRFMERDRDRRGSSA
jgi:hypothetical protein